MSGLTLSVVVCTRNRAADLAACLASLAAQRRRPEEVVVVDASDDDASGAVVRAWAEATPAVAVRHLPSARGLTRQRNAGVAAASGDVLTFLDDDVVLDAGYLAAVADLFAADPALGGVEGTIRTAPLRGRRRLANALRRVLLMDALGRRRVKRSGAVDYDAWPPAVRRVECLSGCNMSFRRAVFSRFRFDEWYDGYGFGEDLDFTFRVSRAFPLVQTPAARLEHRQSPAARDGAAALHEMRVVNRYRFVRRHLPATAATRLAFGWGQLGEVMALARAGDLAGVGGCLRGYRRILAEGAALAASGPGGSR